MKSKIGWTISILVALMLLFSASGKFMAANEDTIKGFEHLGLSMDHKLTLGIVESVSTLLYVIPQTALVGAILITGYMGGAIFAHMRVGDSFVVQALVPILVWIGLGLRRFPEMMAFFRK